ncbi:hypothetical protein [Paenibacillus sp. J2TS4]|uniref:hypothetical protein n=1 Tax=Paenibacillus sp. J2TS4 TaxID=2807194 RepID=UPI001B116D66|nr:hypothetical protein [Paenibacillus sp. J2TS4]GIP36206.1 hypothetical protein J2TS4_54160 [Paenibacillus sp. J2TS4]
MKVLFFANHYKTIVFHKIAAKLIQAGHRVYWISPSHEWAEWLVRNGVERHTLLDLTDYGEEWVAKSKQELSEEDRSFIAAHEGQDLLLSNMILMDRGLVNKKPSYARAFLAVCGKRIKQFLLDHGIQTVFSERTWATELLTVKLCEKLAIANFHPQVIRIPDGRFSFFNTYTEKNFEWIRKPSSEDIRQAEQFLDYFLEASPKPRYFHLNNIVPRIRARWPIAFFQRLIRERRYRYRYDSALPTTFELVGHKFNELFNTWSIRMKDPFMMPHPETRPTRPYVLYAIHKQPEASIDVLGGACSNQLDIIRAMARSTPSTHDLYVKEHSNNIGNNSMRFYKQLLSIPGVKLISPFADSHSLFKRADLVVTVSGTIAYEAGLFGVPAVSVASMFFSPLLVDGNFNPYSDSIAELLRNQRPSLPSHADKVSFIARLLANSFEGTMSCPIEDHTCVKHDNIDLLARGFFTLLDVIEQKQPSAETRPLPLVDHSLAAPPLRVTV